MVNKPRKMGKAVFEKKFRGFFEILFSEALSKKLGNIEIRRFSADRDQKKISDQRFYKSIDDVIEWVHYNRSGFHDSNIDVYFGVNPRKGKGGKKSNIQYVVSFHAEIDYGSEGHKKESSYQTYEEALTAINNFSPKPTIIIHSGGGFHCYFVLTEPIRVEEAGVDVLENINKAICLELGGDIGTHDLTRILRVPGTFNYKLPDNPREVEIVNISNKKYNYEELAQRFNVSGKVIKDENLVENEKLIPDVIPSTIPDNDQSLNVMSDKSIAGLPVSGKIKSLILNGNDGTFLSRSEADMAVITVLVNKGLNYNDIKEVFQKYPIGEKYREQGESYLSHSINKAKEYSDLTEEQMQDPLFISGSIMKMDKGYKLNIVNFQEYFVKRYMLKKHEESYFKYNGKCYEPLSQDDINHLCQKELSTYRHLFTKSMLSDFIHYLIGDVLVNKDEANSNILDYLTLQNGLYDVEGKRLIPHTPDIFTTNLLPYNYDPEAKCPRFIRFLEEVFVGDEEKINFIQEAVGYGFHRSINIPAIFFLVGGGSNGKSVFLNTITNLFGAHNTSSISLSCLSNEYYLLDLLGKMINISTETPRQNFGTDLIKAVVAGDWVTGRVPYQKPTKFRPFAKHYLAMNDLPTFDDTSHGMWRRIYVIDFPKIFSEDEQNKELTEYFKKEELSGIFNWALEGYNRLRNSEFSFPQVKSMEEAKQRYKINSDSVLAFMTEKFIKSNQENDKLLFGNVYEQYRFFCKSEGFKDSVKKKTFKNRLKALNYKVENSTSDGNQVYIFGVKAN